MPNLLHRVLGAIHVPNTQLFASLTHSINHAKPMVLIELRPAKEMISRGIQNWMDYMRFIKSHSWQTINTKASEMRYRLEERFADLIQCQSLQVIGIMLSAQSQFSETPSKSELPRILLSLSQESMSLVRELALNWNLTMNQPSNLPTKPNSQQFVPSTKSTSHATQTLQLIMTKHLLRAVKDNGGKLILHNHPS